MTTLKDIYYIAGLLEGEGSFAFYGCPILQLQMTDFDVVNDAQKILDPTANIRAHNPGGNRKILYHLHISGSIVVQWMMTLYPLMKERRKAKIIEVIKKWKEMPGFNIKTADPLRKYAAERWTPENKIIDAVAKAKGISREEAKELISKSGTVQ